MNLIELLTREMEREAVTTRKFLNIVPTDKFDWKPHPKSMSLKQLSTHLAELPEWADIAVKTDGIDFATMDYKPKDAATTQDLLDILEDSLQKGLAALRSTNEEFLNKTWTMRNGEMLISEDSKGDMVRICISQTIHHRAQLGVFLRLLDIPIPGSYGPSADEMNF
ncbi:MAG: DinB family protein [Mucilaginibacter polytrichastri]|nr:DinB family protein [Mucilaginibacter polytrichastri]